MKDRGGILNFRDQFWNTEWLLGYRQRKSNRNIGKSSANFLKYGRIVGTKKLELRWELSQKRERTFKTYLQNPVISLRRAINSKYVIENK